MNRLSSPSLCLLAATLVASLGASMSACRLLKPQEDPTEHYVLRGFPDQARPSKLTSDSGLVVLIGPVNMPGYLDRTQIVTGGPANDLHVSEYQIWGEPLDTAFTRVVSENVAYLLDSPTILAYPETDITSYDYRAGFTIRRFEQGPDGKARLVTAYAVNGPPGSDLAPFINTSTITTTVATPDDPSSIATAMSQALAQFSQTVARDILKFHRKQEEAEEAEEAEEEEEKAPDNT